MKTLFAGTMLAVMLAVPGMAQTVGKRNFVRLAANQSVTLFGATYRATAPTVALGSLSSELVTVAVIDGALAHPVRP